MDVIPLGGACVQDLVDLWISSHTFLGPFSIRDTVKLKQRLMATRSSFGVFHVRTMVLAHSKYRTAIVTRFLVILLYLFMKLEFSLNIQWCMYESLLSCIKMSAKMQMHHCNNIIEYMHLM
jgi:hypothetical protein